MTAGGGIDRLWRYPVKSMRGQRAGWIDVSPGGVRGDRRYALRDATGRLGSGKNTGRLRHIDGLFRFEARYEDEVAILTLPDGREMAATEPDIDAVLSRILAQPVTLVTEDAEAYVDDSPLHLLTTASLGWLERTLPEAQFDERRFRPNLVLATDGAEPVEQDWIGRTLHIGPEVVLRITAATQRCGMVAFAQDELPRDPSVLRHITRHADLLFGVYAEIIRSGRVHLDDPVTFAAAS